MAALKLKERLDHYRQVSTEEEGRVALTSPGYRDEEDFEMDASVTNGLLDTEIPAAVRPKRHRAKGCCICCGINCGLFWKAFGTVLALFALWNTFKLIRWAFTTTPTGLENMPAYSTTLGCVAAPFIYKDAMTTITVPIGTDKSDHAVDILGSAVGTFVIAQGAANSTEVKYEMTLRTDNKALLDDVSVHFPILSENDPVENSRFQLSTPFDASSSSCMRYDITMYVPPNLRILSVAPHTTTQVQFDPESHITLDTLFVTLYRTDINNMILPNPNIRSSQLTLEIFRGWIVGDASIGNLTQIKTQRGDGVTNVRVHPTPDHGDLPARAELETVTGAGRTDIVYVSDKGYAHRPISSTHMSSRNGDIYLTYSDAEYNGYIDLRAKSYTARNMDGVGTSKGGAQEDAHWVGDKDGGDTMSVKTRAWVGLYF